MQNLEVSLLTMALLMLSAVFGSENASAYGAVRQTAAVSSIPETLVPIGHTIGIKLFSDGVLVVGLSELESAKGERAPAKECGLKVGDLILQADGTEVESTEHFQDLIQEQAGKPVLLQVKRGSRLMELKLRVSRGKMASGGWALGFGTAWPGSAP